MILRALLHWNSEDEWDTKTIPIETEYSLSFLDIVSATFTTKESHACAVTMLAVQYTSNSIVKHFNSKTLFVVQLSYTLSNKMQGKSGRKI